MLNGPPWSDRACIHTCSSAMKFLNWPFSWLLSQLFGVKSLILYGLAVSAKPAWISSRTRCKESALLSGLLLQRHQVCWGGHTCLLLGYATAAAADLEGLQPTPLCDGACQRSATMSNGSLFCGGTLSQRECVGRVIKCTQQLNDKGNKFAGM